MDQRGQDLALRRQQFGGSHHCQISLRRWVVAGFAGVAIAGLVGFVSPALAAPGDPVVGVASSVSGGGWTVTATGAVTAFGGATFYGSETGQHLNDPIVGITASSDGQGYYLIASDGGLFAFGDAHFYGSTGGMHLNQPVVGMAVTPSGGGYWLVASDGGIFSFGNAAFYGSTGRLHLQRPIVGMTSTSDGKGYDLVASDGGLFSFGDAHFYGSMGGTKLAAPVVGMATDPATGGYWLVGSDGGIFSFNAPFHGTATGQQIAGMVPTSNGAGYLEVSTAGVVSPFGATSAAPGVTTTPTSVTPTTPVGGSPGAPVGGGPTAPVAEPTTSVMPNAIFDRPVTGQPVNSAVSAGYVSSVVSQYENNYGSVGVNEFPLYTVAANQSTTAIAVKSGCNPSFIGDIGEVPIPAAAVSGGSSDDPLVIDQPSTNTEWELWQATETNGVWSACWGGKLDTATSNGVFTRGYGLSASGLSYLATMITEADVAKGAIDHTLALDIIDCNTYTAPAVRGDCGSDPGQPQEGTWFRMPADVPMPAGLTAYGQMVFRALQTYGAVVMDHAGAVMIQAEKPADWTASGGTGVDPMTTSWQGHPEYTTLNGIPWGDLQVIVPPGS